MKRLMCIAFLSLIVCVAFARGLGPAGRGYDSYQINPDGTKVCGGAYDSYQINPDGTKVCGGAYDSYQINPDGIYVVGNWFNTQKKRANQRVDPTWTTPVF